MMRCPRCHLPTPRGIGWCTHCMSRIPKNEDEREAKMSSRTAAGDPGPSEIYDEAFNAGKDLFEGGDDLEETLSQVDTSKPGADDFIQGVRDGYEEAVNYWGPGGYLSGRTAGQGEKASDVKRRDL